jgi:hypothetical protein
VAANILCNRTARLTSGSVTALTFAHGTTFALDGAGDLVLNSPLSDRDLASLCREVYTGSVNGQERRMVAIQSKGPTPICQLANCGSAARKG